MINNNKNDNKSNNTKFQSTVEVLTVKYGTICVNMSGNWAMIFLLQSALWLIAIGEECSTNEINWKKRWD